MQRRSRDPYIEKVRDRADALLQNPEWDIVGMAMRRGLQLQVPPRLIYELTEPAEAYTEPEAYLPSTTSAVKAALVFARLTEEIAQHHAARTESGTGERILVIVAHGVGHAALAVAAVIADHHFHFVDRAYALMDALQKMM